MKFKSSIVVILGGLGLGLVGCTAGGEDPGIEYAPDMYVSKGYEAFTQTKKWPTNPGGMSMRLPVKGTIARGQLDYLYPYADNGEGYELSASLVSTVPPTKTAVDNGMALYNTYCWNCHGKKGGNDGPVMQEGRYVKPPWPNYQSDYIKNLEEGKIYHTLTYGKGLMGSHAIYLSPKERWEVIHYVKYLAYGEDGFKFAEESTENSGTSDASDGIETMGSVRRIMTGAAASVSDDDMKSFYNAVESIQFGLLNANIKESSHEQLNILADLLKKYGEIRVKITGHAVDAGADRIEEKLSENRAKSVMEYLVSKGIAASRLTAAGEGGEDQIASNRSSEGRQQNRRVEIELY